MPGSGRAADVDPLEAGLNILREQLSAIRDGDLDAASDVAATVRDLVAELSAERAAPRAAEIESKPASEVVSANVHQLKEVSGLSYKVLTDAMSAAGFDKWKVSTAVEIGRSTNPRRVLWEELLAIAALYGVPVVELLAPQEGEALTLADGMTPLSRDEVIELIVGRGGKAGEGGPGWALAASAIKPEVRIERPARAYWSNRREGER